MLGAVGGAGLASEHQHADKLGGAKSKEDNRSKRDEP
jgi:hypothetical protein